MRFICNVQIVVCLLLSVKSMLLSDIHCSRYCTFKQGIFWTRIQLAKLSWARWKRIQIKNDLLNFALYVYCSWYIENKRLFCPNIVLFIVIYIDSNFILIMLSFFAAVIHILQLAFHWSDCGLIIQDISICLPGSFSCDSRFTWFLKGPMKRFLNIHYFT